MEENSTLQSEYVLEMLWCTVKSRRFFDVCQQFLEYEYLPDKHFKELWKGIKSHYVNYQKPPSFGYLLQTYSNFPEIQNIIASVKVLSGVNKDASIDKLEDFIKQCKFVSKYTDVARIFNEGRHMEAYKLDQTLSKEIAEFTIKKAYYEAVFKDFESRHESRKATEDSTENIVKMAFGIPELDMETHGGVELGGMAGILAQSGAGKSTLLKHIGIHNARRGYNVLHVQGEDTKAKAFVAYDAAWTGQLKNDLEYARIPDEIVQQAIKTASKVQGEIFVHAIEQLNKPSVAIVAQLIEEIQRNMGIKIHCVIVDYLEKFNPANGKKYKVGEERVRREDIADELKNIAVMYQVAMFTATQASNVPADLLNSANFVMTRENVAECKGITRPFNYFLTLNQTDEEYRQQIIRIYGDKFRDYEAKKLITVCQARERGRFYSHEKTINMFPDRVFEAA